MWKFAWPCLTTKYHKGKSWTQPIAFDFEWSFGKFAIDDNEDEDGDDDDDDDDNDEDDDDFDDDDSLWIRIFDYAFQSFVLAHSWGEARQQKKEKLWKLWRKQQNEPKVCEILVG